mmetsp:Transcript_17509/g.27988  ORF Transcript_17509/g.27988 Transcript_17509/m.27988 type:complete len:438 (-) Transcript_17509:152-1465(-)|eukprot:jgi/Bigna1/146332/aug1.112_g21040
MALQNRTGRIAQSSCLMSEAKREVLSLDGDSKSGANPAGNGLQSRFFGCLVGAAIGDALGAPVEGLSQAAIREDPLFAEEGVRVMISQKDMKSWKDIAKSMACTVDELGATRPSGSYTDDTCLMIATARALISSGKRDQNGKSGAASPSCETFGRALAETYAEIEKSSMKGLRGFGSGTEKILKALLEGRVTPSKSGTFLRKDGSNRNGGAMRIAPIGLVYRNAKLASLRHIVKEACWPTHVHAEGIDGALAVAYVVSRCISAKSPADFLQTQSEEGLLRELNSKVCVTDALRRRFKALEESWKSVSKHQCFRWKDSEAEYDIKITTKIRDDPKDWVQIKASDAAAVAIWMFLRHGIMLDDKYGAVINEQSLNPTEALVRTISLGGDTDTLACIVGSMIGALHGPSIFPKKWLNDLERGTELGSNLFEEIAKKLVEL